MNHKNKTVPIVRNRVVPVFGNGIKRYVPIGKGIKMSAPKMQVSHTIETPTVSASLDKLNFGKKKNNIKLSF